MPMWTKRGGLPQYQSNKYLPLKSVIENNGWSVDLSAVKVGARGYCSTPVLCCFKSLGLRNPTINTIKQISKCSMECSFCIWLARNNKAWSSKEIDLSLKTPEDPVVYQNVSSTPSKGSSLKINSPLPVGLINWREHLFCKCHPADTECLSLALE